MKVAVVLFNLGGPDRPEAVKPFLRNLFSDPAILSVPQPIRWFLAWIISSRRAPVARDIYAKIGGRSPILPLTEEQACALEKVIAGDGIEARVFVAMRYWHPFAHETAARVKAFGADRVVLLPLYPQFSKTTTESSFKDWEKAAAAAGLVAPTDRQCCYPLADGFVAAYARLLQEAIGRVPAGQKARVLFSAHGLPERVIKSGDPYQAQVELSAAAIAQAVGGGMPEWRVSYQSKVGPLKWIGPATDDEIIQAGRDGLGLIVVPVAFVSEHSETLVELDMEYAELAQHESVPFYLRVPAVATEPAFVEALAGMVKHALGRGGLCGGGPGGSRLCALTHKACPMPVAK
ncbi:MAG TPA: ferrochelatase [Alphaproteobacteria bacterium]|nr:ferrochelatase [Alphaproteobacteria bacterium]